MYLCNPPYFGDSMVAVMHFGDSANSLCLLDWALWSRGEETQPMAKQILLCFGVCWVISIERRGWVNTASSIELHIVNTQRSLTIMRCYEEPLSSLCGFYRITCLLLLLLLLFMQSKSWLKVGKKTLHSSHTFHPLIINAKGRGSETPWPVISFLNFHALCFLPSLQVLCASSCAVFNVCNHVFSMAFQDSPLLGVVLKVPCRG